MSQKGGLMDETHTDRSQRSPIIRKPLDLEDGRVPRGTGEQVDLGVVEDLKDSRYAAAEQFGPDRPVRDVVRWHISAWRRLVDVNEDPPLDQVSKQRVRTLQDLARIKPFLASEHDYGFDQGPGLSEA